MNRLLLAVILIISFSCSFDKQKKDRKKKNEVSNDCITKVYYPDGKLRAEVPMVDGKKTGLAKDYYKNGKLHLEIEYVNSIKHGITKMYYENGNLYEETSYHEGKIHGMQKKYRQDGKLSSEARYHYGEPCAGLKEYLMDGSPKKNYPSIVIKPTDKILMEDKYILRLAMSDNSKNVIFYQGKLSSDCLSDNIERIYETPQKGISELSFYLPRGAFMMEEINIIAKVKTVQGNEFITQRRYNLAIDHK